VRELHRGGCSLRRASLPAAPRRRRRLGGRPATRSCATRGLGELTGGASPQASKGILGKPTLNDLKSGLSTAPTLFAAEEFPALVPLIKRRFKHEGDVQTAAALVYASKGIDRARALAAEHAQIAAEAVRGLTGGREGGCREGWREVRMNRESRDVCTHQES
jgi:hypothetical protein